MVLMQKTEGAGQEHGVKVFVAAKQCQGGSSPLCEKNNPYIDFRYYQFDVEATDFAGNVGRAQAFVIIEPDGSDDASTGSDDASTGSGDAGTGSDSDESGTGSGDAGTGDESPDPGSFISPILSNSAALNIIQTVDMPWNTNVFN